MWVRHVSSTLSDIEGLPSSFLAHTLEPPASLKEDCAANNLNDYQIAKPLINLNIPVITNVPVTEYETRLDILPLMPQPQQQGISS